MLFIQFRANISVLKYMRFKCCSEIEGPELITFESSTVTVLDMINRIRRMSAATFPERNKVRQKLYQKRAFYLISLAGLKSLEHVIDDILRFIVDDLRLGRAALKFLFLLYFGLR